MYRFNREVVYNGFRDFYAQYLKATFTEKHKKNLDFLLYCIEADAEWEFYTQIANFLAQIGHETAWTYAPIKEYRAKIGTKHRLIQDKYWNTGYYGRGYIQLTWKDNYIKLSRIVNVDLVNTPDNALRPTVSYQIAAIGMRNGLFTGRKLSDFINENVTDYQGARKIVNGTDRAAEIAKYSLAIEKILEKSFVQEEVFAEASNTTIVEDIDPPPISVPAERPVPTLTENNATTPPVQIDEHTPISMPGWKTWKTAFASVFGSLSIAVSSFGAWLSGLIKDQTFQKYVLYLALFGIAAALLTGLIYLVIRALIVMQRERIAAELTLKELEIRSDPTRYNVVVNEVREIKK